MFRKTITIIVLVFFIFYTGCASVVSKVQVKESEYDAIKIAEKIFVTTKAGVEHEVIEFKFTETHLIGKEIFRITKSFQFPKKKTKHIKISLSDIKSVKVMAFRDSKGEIITKEEIKMNMTIHNRTNGAILGIIVFGVSPAYFLIKGLHDVPLDDILGGAFILSAFGALLGYMVGNNWDKKKAIDKIEKEREQEKEKDSKEDKQD